jgi:hypothetical protein
MPNRKKKVRNNLYDNQRKAPSIYEDLKQKLPNPPTEVRFSTCGGGFGDFEYLSKFPKPSIVG